MSDSPKLFVSDAFVAIDEGAEVWARVAGSMRRCRVLERYRTRVRLAYYTGKGERRERVVAIGRIRTEKSAELYRSLGWRVCEAAPPELAARFTVGAKR